jgi:hypothetical protein
MKSPIITYTLKLVGSLSIYGSSFVTFDVVLSDPCSSSVISSTLFNAD